ncbi:hypothetical protein [Lentimonas sp. CC19]|uniref:hypothetical protein n=1 Tax=Lentimonas sp. CC19 TaxID=2676097 RepID=UPI001389577A|nr:hypothetical protein [Lentimonas sp. CC19]
MTQTFLSVPVELHLSYVTDKNVCVTLLNHTKKRSGGKRGQTQGLHRPRHRNSNAQSILNHVMDSVHRFSGDEGQPDDLTLIAIKHS